MTPTPYISAELIAWMDERFPERTPDPDWTLCKVRVETGKREVVRFLTRTHEEQLVQQMSPTTETT